MRSSKWVTEQSPRAEDLGRSFSKELTIDSLYRQRGDVALAEDGELLREERKEVPAHTRSDYRKRNHEDADTVLNNLGIDIHSDRRFYKLDDESTYLATFGEATDVPEGMVGYVAPKEALVSMGVKLHGSYVGPEEPRTGAFLYVDDRIACLEADAAIAELAVWEPADPWE